MVARGLFCAARDTNDYLSKGLVGINEAVNYKKRSNLALIFKINTYISNFN